MILSWIQAVLLSFVFIHLLFVVYLEIFTTLSHFSNILPLWFFIFKFPYSCFNFLCFFWFSFSLFYFLLKFHLLKQSCNLIQFFFFSSSTNFTTFFSFFILLVVFFLELVWSWNYCKVMSLWWGSYSIDFSWEYDQRKHNEA